MSTAVVCCSGVGQTKFVSDGMGELYDEVRQLPNVTAFLRRRWESVHDMVITLEHENDFARIVLAGHSRGGLWCAEVAAELQLHGRFVDAMFFADGWSPSGKIVVPPNVNYLETWIQSTDRPAWKRHPHGSEIEVDHAGTRWISHEADTDVGHNQMDSLPAFWAAVIAAATAA